MADTKDEIPVRVVDRRWWARQDGDRDSDDRGLRKPTYVEELERQLADLTSQLQTLVADRRRAADEFEQAKARLRREASRDVERAKRSIIGELLDVLDNLDRALVSAEREAGKSGAEGLVRGVELVREQFLARLESLGVKRLPALGQRFDAAHHEAISTAPVTDEAADGTVVGVVREGYVIGDELLRPASVVVGKL